MTYSMTCTCGHEISVDAEGREDAVAKIKEIMTPEAIAAHMAEKHQGQSVPSDDQVYTMIEQVTKEAIAPASA